MNLIELLPHPCVRPRVIGLAYLPFIIFIKCFDRMHFFYSCLFVSQLDSVTSVIVYFSSYNFFPFPFYFILYSFHVYSLFYLYLFRSFVRCLYLLYSIYFFSSFLHFFILSTFLSPLLFFSDFIPSVA